MTRSKFSIKAALLAGGIGLSIAGFAGPQPAAAQSYFDGYSCPAGYVYDPAYGCTVPGDAYAPYDYGYYGYLPYGVYGPYYGEHREFGHGFGHGMGGGLNHGVGFAHASGGYARSIGGGFADRGVNVAHLGGGSFAHGMGVAHVGGFGGGHR